MDNLKGYTLNAIDFENKAKNGTQLKLQNQFKYRVRYAKETNKCVGELEFRIGDADLQPFELKISLIAEFEYDQNMQRDEIHSESFTQIFPYVRQIISSITSMSGMPPLMIPFMKVDKEKITSPEEPPFEDTYLN